jgi:hypothetical protein
MPTTTDVLRSSPETDQCGAFPASGDYGSRVGWLSFTFEELFTQPHDIHKLPVVPFPGMTSDMFPQYMLALLTLLPATIVV